jgi:hypothetical protein
VQLKSWAKPGRRCRSGDCCSVACAKTAAFTCSRCRSDASRQLCCLGRVMCTRRSTSTVPRAVAILERPQRCGLPGEGSPPSRRPPPPPRTCRGSNGGGQITTAAAAAATTAGAACLSCAIPLGVAGTTAVRATSSRSAAVLPAAASPPSPVHRPSQPRTPSEESAGAVGVVTIIVRTACPWTATVVIVTFMSTQWAMRGPSPLLSPQHQHAMTSLRRQNTVILQRKASMGGAAAVAAAATLVAMVVIDVVHSKHWLGLVVAALVGLSWRARVQGGMRRPHTFPSSYHRRISSSDSSCRRRLPRRIHSRPSRRLPLRPWRWPLSRSGVGLQETHPHPRALSITTTTMTTAVTYLRRRRQQCRSAAARSRPCHRWFPSHWSTAPLHLSTTSLERRCTSRSRCPPPTTLRWLASTTLRTVSLLQPRNPARCPGRRRQRRRHSRSSDGRRHRRRSFAQLLRRRAVVLSVWR